MIIAIDFDGTVVEHQFPEIGDPLPGAIETLKALQTAGHTLIIWTYRELQQFTDVYSWITEHVDIDEDRLAVNRTDPREMAALRKQDIRPHRILCDHSLEVYADLYIDDRNLGGFPGWDAVRDALLTPV